MYIGMPTSAWAGSVQGRNTNLTSVVVPKACLSEMYDLFLNMRVPNTWERPPTAVPNIFFLFRVSNSCSHKTISPWWRAVHSVLVVPIRFCSWVISYSTCHGSDQRGVLSHATRHSHTVAGGYGRSHGDRTEKADLLILVSNGCCHERQNHKHVSLATA